MPHLPADPSEARRIGLCLGCQFARSVVSARGSQFWLCSRATSDPTFPKYPRLPVIRCRGFAPKDDSA